MFIRGGSIIPTRERSRRSSPLMRYDPYTLRIALDSAGEARGEVYIDDGNSFDHEKGQIVWREFVAKKSGKKGLKVSSKDLVGDNLKAAVDGVELSVYDPKNKFAEELDAKNVGVERIVVLGLSAKPSTVKTDDGKVLDWDWEDGVAATGKKEGGTSVLTIKNPVSFISKDWGIVIG